MNDIHEIRIQNFGWRAMLVCERYAIKSFVLLCSFRLLNDFDSSLECYKMVTKGEVLGSPSLGHIY